MNFHCIHEIQEDTINIGIRCYDVIRYGLILQMKSMVRPEVQLEVMHDVNINLVITSHIPFNENHNLLDVYYKKEKSIMNERRDAYIQRLKSMLDEWNVEIDRLAEREDKAGSNAKIEYHKKLDELRAKRDDIKIRIDAIQKSGDDAWEDLKFDLESSWEFLREGLSVFKSEFQKGYNEGLKED